jgi:hypothetical protein
VKIAFFTPLNPIQSGISDYSEELLLTLHGAKVGGWSVEIDLFIDRGYKPANAEITRQFRVLPDSAFGRAAGRYDSIIYQMGNSSAHAYIYDEMLHHHGVVVMHEFVLHHLRMWMALNRGKRKAYLWARDMHGLRVAVLEQRRLVEDFELAPLEGLSIILRDTLALGVHGSYFDLGECIALFCDLLKKAKRSRGVSAVQRSSGVLKGTGNDYSRQQRG